MPSEFEKQVYAALKKVPRGKVTTYGRLAQAIGRKKAARAIGNAMNKNPYAPQVPCHRVVKSNGEIGGFAHGVQKKIAMLKKEGIAFEGDKIINFYDVLYQFQ